MINLTFLDDYIEEINEEYMLKLIVNNPELIELLVPDIDLDNT